MERIAYSVAETCKLLSLGRTTVYQLASEGRLRLVKIGRRSVITAESISRLLERAAAVSPD